MGDEGKFGFTALNIGSLRIPGDAPSTLANQPVMSRSPEAEDATEAPEKRVCSLAYPLGDREGEDETTFRGERFLGERLGRAAEGRVMRELDDGVGECLVEGWSMTNREGVGVRLGGTGRLTTELSDCCRKWSPVAGTRVGGRAESILPAASTTIL